MIQIRPREGSKVALFAGFIFEPGEGGRQAREGEGGVREGRGESYRREIVIVNLARKAGRQSGGQGNGEERSAVRGGPLAHSLTKEPAYSSILSPHACLVKSLCQQQLHPPRGGDATAAGGGVSRGEVHETSMGRVLRSLALAPVS